MKNNIYILIPVFNEGEVLEDIIIEIKKEGYKNIIVVDDGSADNTYEVAKRQEIIVLRHSINRGKGAAIKTGFEAAKLLKTEIIITVDGDGQHDPKDIKKIVKKIEEGYDVVLGVRRMKLDSMPLIKIAYNYIANLSTWIIYGFWTCDSQSGLRGYSKKAISVISTKNDRYEYESEVLREIAWHKLKSIEVPINVFYTKYSRSKKQKQSLYNGIGTVLKMIITS